MAAISNIQFQEKPYAFEDVFAKQRIAFEQNKMPSREDRIRNLDILHNAILDNKEALISAVSRDFSNRASGETLLAEIFPLLEGINYCRKNLKRWMKPQNRKVPMLLAPARVRVHPQPVGVVGIVVPWNFPIFLGFSPLIYALAAGNRAMLKMSEFAPATGELIARIMADAFPNGTVVVVTGDADVAARFTKLPFDHLVFTGSTTVGKIVMRAAAENLTPVTLELGGKSPAIIHPDFPVKEAARRIGFGKSINAGQVCVSPDYILCHESKISEFVDEFSAEINSRYPSLVSNEDYTAIITDRQKERLEENLRDAENKGARLIEINPSAEDFNGTKKLPMTIVLNANENMKVMQEEIFGPILPVLTYQNLQDALRMVNEKDRPLALYYFDWDASRANKVVEQTHSGGVCINDTMSHVLADDIPFGGIGPSGLGHYHGREGFERFSHMKSVVRKGRINPASLVGAPWDRPIFRLMSKMHWLKFRKKSIK
ncbi:MAG: coniferyl aldehyde dehydrogenase [Pseudomonadota bacterium]